MAKDLTSNMIASKSRRYGTEPINLLEISFGGAVGTKYYSDRVVTVGLNTYEAVVKDWGDIDFLINNIATTNDLQIVLLNTLSSPISNIFATETPESKVAILYQWYVGDEEADKAIMFNGRIASPVKYSVDTVQLDIVNRITDLETPIGRVLTQDDYPRSLPAHRGRVIPQVVGTVEDVPAVCIFTAGKSALRETLNDESLVIEVDDGSVFPTDAVWTMVLEEEQILMAANPTGGNTLTATQRGYNGTAAAVHTLGTQMYEQSTTFRYQVYDDQFSVKAASIHDVRVNGVLLPTSAYTIDQSTYPGQIVFTVYPQIDQEKETDFDEYLFDTVVNNEEDPYADSPDNLIDDDDSNFAWLLSGQKVDLQRNAVLNNNNQFKRAFLQVTYYTDREEWNGNVQARATWDGNNLGLLPDPAFPEEMEGELKIIQEPELISVDEISNPVEAPAYTDSLFNMVKGHESEVDSQVYSEEVDPSGLSIETKVVNPDAYPFPGGSLTSESMVPPGYFSAVVDGLTGKVILFSHPCVGSSAQTWEADVFNFKWIDWVFSGFSFSPPSSAGTARITDITPRFTDQFDPLSAASVLRQYRVRKRGVHDLEIISATPTALKQNALFVHEIAEFYMVLRTSTSVISRPQITVTERDAVIAELWGKVQDVYLKVGYELIPDAPEPVEAPVVAPPPVKVPEPVRQSNEFVKTFEITEYVDDWADLLNKSARIVFESDGELPGTNLYIKDMRVTTESGKYTFEFSDEITATVSGFYVDGTEIDTNYGSNGELITRPDQVVKFLLTWNSIFSLSDLDLDTYTASIPFYLAQTYRLDFAIVEEITLRDLLEKIAFQVRTDQYWESGLHKIKVLEVTSSVLKQITSSDIENLSIERSDIEDVINLLEVRYSIDYSFLVEYTPNKFRDTITIENPDSQTEYNGIRKNKEKDTRFLFELIRDDTTASHVSNYYLSFYSVIRRYVNLKCFLNQLELEKHDIIGVTFPLDSLSNTPARILSNKLMMGGNSQIDQIDLYVLMEDYIYYQLELTDDIEFSDAIQLALIPLVSLTNNVEFSDSITFGIEANIPDSVSFADEFSYNFTKSLVIRDGSTGGWGVQSWGDSDWGGNGASFSLSDDLTLLRIAALGTGLFEGVDSVSITDELILKLVHRIIIADNDELNAVILIGDELTITLV